MTMRMKSYGNLYICLVFVNNQHCNKEIWKKLYHLNAFDQNVSFNKKRKWTKLAYLLHPSDPVYSDDTLMKPVTG